MTSLILFSIWVVGVIGVQVIHYVYQGSIPTYERLNPIPLFLLCCIWFVWVPIHILDGLIKLLVNTIKRKIHEHRTKKSVG